MIDSEIEDIARTAIAELGVRAAAVMEERVAAHRRDNELEGAAFWAEVAAAVRMLLESENEAVSPK